MSERKIYVSGVLCWNDVPAWVPHMNLTEEEATKRVLELMKTEALRYDFNSSGFTDKNIRGNFHCVSGGFYIENPSEDTKKAFQEAWMIHKRTRFFRAGRMQCKLGDKIRYITYSKTHHLHSYEKPPIERKIYDDFRPLMKSLTNILNQYSKFNLEN